jgi:hypothetical protein
MRLIWEHGSQCLEHAHGRIAESFISAEKQNVLSLANTSPLVRMYSPNAYPTHAHRNSLPAFRTAGY